MVLIDPVTASQAPNDQKDASTASTSSSGNAGQQSDVFSAESTQSVGKTYSLERENDETVWLELIVCTCHVLWDWVDLTFRGLPLQ